MFKRVIFTTTLAALAAYAAPAGAQQGLRPLTSGGLIQFTPYAGYMIFGDFLKGPIGTSLATKNGPIYGAQLGIHITPNLSIVGNVAYSSGDLQIGLPFLGGIGVGDSKIWLYDGNLQLDLPTAGTALAAIKPFVQVGAGAMHYDISAASIMKTSATNFAFNAGAGLDFQITPTIGVRLMAKDYIGKFDFKDATSFDIQGRTAQNWALTGGLKIGF